MSESIKAFRVSGRVQMVGFRWWTSQHAERLGLRGSVRNCGDGSVEVVVAGPREAVEEMVRLLAAGPRSSRVDRLDELTPPTDVPDTFLVSG